MTPANPKFWAAVNRVRSANDQQPAQAPSPGPGRPKRSSAPPGKPLQVRMTEPERAALDAFAEAQGVSAGEVVRQALRAFLSQETGNRIGKPADPQTKP